MRRALIGLAVLAASPTVVKAQTSTSPIVAASRAKQNADAPPAQPAKTPGQGLTPSRAPTIAPFRLTDVQITGSSLDVKSLRTAYAASLGQVVATQDLIKLSNSLAQLYADHSDIALYTVSVPNQQPQDGVLKVDIVEGFVQGVRVQGPAGRRDYGLLRHYAAMLTIERPLRRSTLERYISLIRDIGGLNASVQLVAGAHPGAVDLVITIAPRALEVSAAIDNRGTAYLGRTQVELDADLHSVLREGDDTHATLALPTDTRLFQYYALSHSQPFGGEGATAQVSLGYLTTRPSFIDLQGHAVSLGFQVNAPVIRSYNQSLLTTFGVDGLNSQNALLGEALSDDRTRAARLGATYTRQSQNYALLANAVGSFGFDGLGARVLNPALTDLTFDRYNLKLNINVALPANTVLRLDSAAQYSGDRLPGAEQFALGGEEFGRAYEAAAVTGDKGVAGSAELAWKLDKRLPGPLRGSEVYGFADGGQTYTLSRLGLPSTSETVASVGGGGRITLGAKAVFQVEIAKGLTNPLPTEDHEVWRGVFSVKSVF